MILYLDASALVKRYVSEPGSTEVGDAVSAAEVTGTVIVSRAEVAAALSKGVRVGALTPEGALESLETFTSEWADLVRVQVTEVVIAHADSLAWRQGLRSYDAVQLAAASVWQDALGEPVTLATFDRQLWAAAGRVGLVPFPADLPTLLNAWKAT